ncbi:MAG: hypothetical protein KU37_00095 [Sulfuricurvum sp. PC08-66]|nr:MAG: hypothetical protein KU37_00095 [Sulfuricurvum sp. PC08-66]
MQKETQLLFTLAQLHTKFFKFVDRRLSVHSISFSEFYVMHTLFGAPQHTLRRIDLAEAVGMSASGVTRLLNPMEKLHLIQKEQNPRDARVSLVKLSSDGEQVYLDAMQSFEASAQMLLESASAQTVEHFVESAKALL